MDVADPFALCANPAAYVARPATERILAQLETSVTLRRRPTLLVGPPGMGKTFLLRCLEQRLSDRLRTVYVPIPTLSPTELCRWVLAQLREESGPDPALALANVSARLQSQHSALLLLVDDFASMTKEALRQLLELWWVSEGGFRLLFASIEDDRYAALLPEFEGSAETVSFCEPMTPTETTEYIRTRLQRSDVEEEVSARFDDALLARIQRETGGVPAWVNAAGEAVLFATRYRRELPEEDLSTQTEEVRHEKVSDTTAFEGKLDWPPAEDDFAAARRGRHRKKEAKLQAEEETRRKALAEEDAKRRAAEEAKRRALEEEARRKALAEEDAKRRAAEDAKHRALEEEARRKALAEEAKLRAAEDAKHRAEEAERRRAIEAADAKRRALEEEAAAPILPPALLEVPSAKGAPAALEIPAAESRPTEKSVGAKLWLVAAGLVLAFGAGLLVLHLDRTPDRVSNASTQSNVAATPVAGAEARKSLSPASGATQSSAVLPGAQPTESTTTDMAQDRSSLVAARGGEPSPLNETSLSESLALEPVLVSVNATPWAIIEVDGIEFGETPLAEIPLLPGQHKFVAKMPGGRVVERTILVDSKTQQIVFD